MGGSGWTTPTLLLGGALIGALAWAGPGCTETEPQLTLGDQCDLASECEAPLTCRLARCRRECATIRDCPLGSLCVTDAEGLGACTLPDEDTCDRTSDCPEPLVCPMGRCTNECGADGDCPAGAACREASCVDLTETDCEVDSDCGAGLSCATDRRCRQECVTSRDCRVGTTCQSGSCLPRPADLDGGNDAGADGGAADANVPMDAGTASDAGSEWDASWIWRDAGGDAGWDSSLPECDVETPCPSAPNATVECVSGMCEITGCTAPWADCDGAGANGCETNTETHRDHCSACGSACPAGQACLSAACTDATVTSVDVGAAHGCAAWSNGQVTCWGSNVRGELGDGEGGGSSRPRPVPVMVSGLTDVDSLDAGGFTVCAVKTDGTVWCWGSNSNGQLGDGTTTNRYVPVQAGSLTDATGVSVGTQTVCALRSGGAVSCWGDNNSGSVGSGSTAITITSPTAVSGLTDATQLSAGYVSCAIRSTGALVCWGLNTSNEIDDTATTRYYTPVAASSFADAGITPSFVMTDNRVVVAASDGTAACRGYNDIRFECGVGHPGVRITSPETQPGVSEALTGDGQCWVTTGGQIQCWARVNQSGAAGIGIAEFPHAEPVTALGVTDAVELGNSGGVTCYRSSAGSVLCAGSGKATGTGTVESRMYFTPVEGMP